MLGRQKPEAQWSPQIFCSPTAWKAPPQQASPLWSSHQERSVLSVTVTWSPFSRALSVLKHQPSRPSTIHCPTHTRDLTPAPSPALPERDNSPSGTTHLDPPQPCLSAQRFSGTEARGTCHLPQPSVSDFRGPEPSGGLANTQSAGATLVSEPVDPGLGLRMCTLRSSWVTPLLLGQGHPALRTATLV